MEGRARLVPLIGCWCENNGNETSLRQRLRLGNQARPSTVAAVYDRRGQTLDHELGEQLSYACQTERARIAPFRTPGGPMLAGALLKNKLRQLLISGIV